MVFALPPDFGDPCRSPKSPFSLGDFKEVDSGNMRISLQLAGETDLQVIIAIMNAAFRGASAEQGWSIETGYVTGNRTDEVLLREEIAGVCQPEIAIFGKMVLGLTYNRSRIAELGVRPQAPYQRRGVCGRARRSNFGNNRRECSQCPYLVV